MGLYHQWVVDGCHVPPEKTLWKGHRITYEVSHPGMHNLKQIIQGHLTKPQVKNVLLKKQNHTLRNSNVIKDKERQLNDPD